MPYKDPEVRRVKAKEYSRIWKERHPDWQIRHNAERRERYATDPEYRQEVFKPAPKHVHAAHMRVYKALKRGEIVRPDECSQCGRKAFVEAAHENYTERLAIRWLCRSCHRAWDALHPKTGAPPASPQFEPLRNRKLDTDKAAAIREAYAAGVSQVALGKQYGVSRTLIGFVVRGKIWN